MTLPKSPSVRGSSGESSEHDSVTEGRGMCMDNIENEIPSLSAVGDCSEVADVSDAHRVTDASALDKTMLSTLSRGALIVLCKKRGIRFGYNDRKSDLLEKIGGSL